MKEQKSAFRGMTEVQIRAEVAQTARSFLGAKEGSEEHLALLAVYNAQEPLPRGYKMTVNDAWCAMACVAWSILAGVESIVPKECSCSRLITQAKEMGIWVESDGYKPKLGDWCVYDWGDDGKGDCTGAPDHIGIVTKVGASGFTVTEGNYSNRVKDRTMQVDGKHIRGFICPDYASLAWGFSDVADGAWYTDAVDWAQESGLITGITGTTFCPSADCTRGQIVTMLWRAAGSPAAAGTMPFGDVPASSYCAAAVRWAHETGITNGIAEVSFAPDAPCARAQIVTMLWRANGSPVTTSAVPFTDVISDAWYTAAIRWAWANGIVEGVDAIHFAPDATCTRAEAVAMLYRAAVM